MNNQDNLQPGLRQRANDLWRQLAPSEHKALLIKCWMSHDARWFMAVAQEYGLPVANQLNKIAAHEIGKVEAQRIVRALPLPTVTTLDDYLLAQEVFICLLGSDLLDYSVVKVSDKAYQMQVQSCFAHENAVRAGIAEQYECGILARITGWFAALGLAYEINPSLGKCLRVQGQECIYTIALAKGSTLAV
jgi:hypothetical protein